MHGQLDQHSGGGLEPVRDVVVHQRRVVREARSCKQLRRARVQLPERCAIPARPRSGQRLEHLRAALDDRTLLRLAQRVRRLVEVVVPADLVPRGDDRAYRVGIPPRGEARDEERRAHVCALEHTEQPRDADLGPVGLMAHRRRAIGEERVDREDRRLRIDVERDRARRACLARPAELHEGEPTLPSALRAAARPGA